MSPRLCLTTSTFPTGIRECFRQGRSGDFLLTRIFKIFGRRREVSLPRLQIMDPHIFSVPLGSVAWSKRNSRMQLELTVDILQKGWTTIPVGLGRVGVSSVDLVDSETAEESQIRYFDFKITVTKLSPRSRATGGECGLCSATCD